LTRCQSFWHQCCSQNWVFIYFSSKTGPPVWQSRNRVNHFKYLFHHPHYQCHFVCCRNIQLTFIKLLLFFLLNIDDKVGVCLHFVLSCLVLLVSPDNIIKFLLELFIGNQHIVHGSVPNSLLSASSLLVTFWFSHFPAVCSAKTWSGKPKFFYGSLGPAMD